jgi:single-stranded DNA-binding protein
MPNPESPKFVNFVKLTGRIGTEPEPRYTADGNLWVKARVSISMGKADDGQYKPSLWLTAKAFTRDGDATLPEALNNLKKGDLVTLSGRLAYEEYTTAKGEKRSDLSLLVNKIEPVSVAEPAAAEADDAFDPPTA